jgi:hypothetical protein
MRLLSTLVTGHRLLDQELADRQIEEGKTLDDFSFFNVKGALHSRVWMWMTSAHDSAVRAE